jgi:hypothetical protein
VAFRNTSLTYKHARHVVDTKHLLPSSSRTSPSLPLTFTGGARRPGNSAVGAHRSGPPTHSGQSCSLARGQGPARRRDTEQGPLPPRVGAGPHLPPGLSPVAAPSVAPWERWLCAVPWQQWLCAAAWDRWPGAKAWERWLERGGLGAPAPALARAGTWAVLFMSRTKHDILARPKARHDTINFGPCRHDTNTRVVSCLGSRHDERHGTTRILGRAWAGTARKWPICKSVGYCFLIACVICII